MKLINTKVTAIAAAMSLAVTASVAVADIPYEVWGSDQSNSVAGATGPGQLGSFLWVWDSEDVNTQLGGGDDAQAMGCDPANTPGAGPCDMLEVFPGSLKEVNENSATGNKLQDLPQFGRLHGMLPDPQNRYMNINSFTPGGGYVGIVDGDTKEAVALWRVTQTNAPSGTGRSLHMSFWSADGNAMYLANLHGRILERIDIKRNKKGKIVSATYNKSASLGVGKNMAIVDEATAFSGKNAHGNKLVSEVKGNYKKADLGNLTPAGYCRENSCGGTDAPNGGRPGNVIVCPIVSNSDKVYITFGGGGLLVADGNNTPMNIVSEYDQETLNGAGCGGIQQGDNVWLNAGASAGGSGATQSTFTMYTIDDTVSGGGFANTPLPLEVFKDIGNTSTLGNTFGPASNGTGQLPGTTTRRDAHGMGITSDGAYIHQSDRLQNNVVVFDTANPVAGPITTYDLTSANGDGTGGDGPCAAKAADGVPAAYANDPAPDLMGTDPNGDYLMVATRGPNPVSVGHNAQGSCPGVGIIELTNGGQSGKLVGVLRTTNNIDTTAAGASLADKGGYNYVGMDATEKSDPHGASVRIRVEDE